MPTPSTDAPSVEELLGRSQRSILCSSVRDAAARTGAAVSVPPPADELTPDVGWTDRAASVLSTGGSYSCERCADFMMLRRRAETLEQELSNHEALQHENRLLHKEIVHLKHYGADLAEDQDEGRGTVMQYKQEVARLNAVETTLRASLHDSQREMSKLRSTIAELTAWKAQRKAEDAHNAPLAEEVTYLTEKLRKVEKNLDGYTSLYATSQQKAALLEQDLTEVRYSLEKTREDLSEARQIHAMDAKMLEEKQGALSGLEKGMGALEVTNLALNVQIQNQSDREAEVEHLKAILTKLETETPEMHKAADCYLNIHSAPPPKLVRDQKHRGRNCERLAFASSAVQRPGLKGKIREKNESSAGVPLKGGGVQAGVHKPWSQMGMVLSKTPSKGRAATPKGVRSTSSTRGAGSTTGSVAESEGKESVVVKPKRARSATFKKDDNVIGGVEAF